MSEKKVLTQEEITELKELQATFKNLTEVSGVLEMQYLNIQLKKEQVKSELGKLQQEELNLASKLEKKYGQGSISLETGEFLPNN